MIDHWVEDGVGRVHLNDPDRRNALSKELSDALAEAVASLDAGAIVLTAEAPVFCSGGVLDDLIAPRFALAESYAGMTALASAAVPTIAVVDGPAIGAGVNLPLACDVVIAGRGARFDPRFLDVGIHPGGGHLARLSQRIGRQGALALVLCGDTLTGEEAERAGLAWRCVDDPLTLALTLARRAAGRDRELVARTKATLDTLTDDPFALELDAQQWSVDRPGFAEGVQRIKESLAKRADR
ncbi:MAG: Enoyl-CoA hydratase/isomerase [Acidimicrobiales bacterium]|nr:Enoyl-CoA hydratase/isomerase [Acidimicrobiales bacterium]